jgi:hypothetical protein
MYYECKGMNEYLIVKRYNYLELGKIQRRVQKRKTQSCNKLGPIVRRLETQMYVAEFLQVFANRHLPGK